MVGNEQNIVENAGEDVTVQEKSRQAQEIDEIASQRFPLFDSGQCYTQHATTPDSLRYRRSIDIQISEPREPSSLGESQKSSLAKPARNDISRQFLLDSRQVLVRLVTEYLSAASNINLHRVSSSTS
jgi:hypothetical protein